MTFEDFMNQPPIDILAMRSDSEPFKACAEANVAWHASDAKNLIWSSESIVETLKRCDRMSDICLSQASRHIQQAIS